MPIGQSGGLSGSRPRVRSATAEDLVQLPALEAASDTLLEGLIGPDSNGSLTHAGALPPPAAVAELASARRILVAGEPPAGFARIEEVDGQAHLEQLSVHPSAAGSGLGRLLVESALQWAREQGYRSMRCALLRRFRSMLRFIGAAALKRCRNRTGNCGRCGSTSGCSDWTTWGCGWRCAGT
ncbi:MULTISPECIES: GNAT family N-acetyltransferase [unclassified Arthrobacter]|uniref:GNAT family N-acetyltransferase n=1 Tax=unclassified Arthrobacter TaxID=235627 RepID=UPI001C626805